MTNEEAIKRLKEVQAEFNENWVDYGGINEAFKKAYQALAKRSQGEWIKVKEERMSVDMSGEIVTQYKCSKCGRVIATFPSKLADYYPFCHCGADMRDAESHLDNTSPVVINKDFYKEDKSNPINRSDLFQ